MVLIKSYVIQLPVVLFLDVLYQQGTSFIIVKKKIFNMSFPFLMDSPQPPIPHPINSQNPQSLTTFLLMPPNSAPKTTLPL